MSAAKSGRPTKLRSPATTSESLWSCAASLPASSARCISCEMSSLQPDQLRAHARLDLVEVDAGVVGVDEVGRPRPGSTADGRARPTGSGSGRRLPADTMISSTRRSDSRRNSICRNVDAPPRARARPRRNSTACDSSEAACDRSRACGSSRDQCAAQVPRLLALQRLDGDQRIDEQPVAERRRNPAGGGVRTGDQPLFLQVRHDVADRRRRQFEVGEPGQCARADRMTVGDVALDQRLQQQSGTIVHFPTLPQPADIDSA